MTISNSDKDGSITRYLTDASTTSVMAFGTKTANLVITKRIRRLEDDRIVYRIPCDSCKKSYSGETYRGLETMNRKHKTDIKHHRMANAFINHIDVAGHLPKTGSKHNSQEH